MKLTCHFVPIATLIALTALGTLGAGGAFGAGIDSGAGAGYEPRVPVSALARPAAWFDPERFGIATEVSVGTGFGGRTDALQVTSLSYRFAGPLSLNMSLGNQLGGNLSSNGRGLFLAGLDLGYRPFSSLLIQIHYQDYRSALQRASRSADSFGLIP